MNPVFIASFWMLLALSGFSLMALAAREASAQLQTFQILFLRSLIALLLISFLLTLKGWRRLKINHIRLHLARNITHYLGQYGWFYGIAFLPLAEVFALEFTVPIWAAIIASVLLREQFNRYKLVAIFFGIIGVVLILKPGLAIIHPAALAVLLGALSYGFSHTLSRSLALKTNILSILFFMSLIQLLLAAIPTFSNDLQYIQDLTARLDNITLLYIFIIALSGLLAHYAMTKALTHADVTVVIPIDFLRLPLITLLAYLIYQETVDYFLMLGALIMVLGNMINVYFNSKITPGPHRRY